METSISTFHNYIETSPSHFFDLFRKIFLFFFAPLLFCSCDGIVDECIEAEDFDGPSFTVNANNNFKFEGGSYVNTDTSQYADWNNTGFVTNGDDFIIEIIGQWTAWYGNSASRANKEWLCHMQTFNEGVQGVGRNTEFRIAEDYQKHIASLDIEEPLVADDQDPCWYTSGNGLYMGLFGKQGALLPSKIYHLHANEISCDPIYRHCADNVDISFCRSSSTKWAEEGGGCYTIELKCEDDEPIQEDDNLCLDDQEPTKKVEVDKTRYFYKSGEMFTRNGGDHTAGEVIKLVILDRYYSDNYGSYKVNFHKGVGSVDKGVLEYIISWLEDSILGEPTDCTYFQQFAGVDKKTSEEKYVEIKTCTGPREGGILKIVYDAISMDGTLLTVARLMITLYIAFTGFGFLLGVIKMNQQEVIIRLIKIGFVLVFLGPNTWEMYDNYVVRFFKDGMDDAVSMITTSVDKYYESNIVGDYTILSGASQEGKVTGSQSGRFAFIDNILENTLFSKNASIKLFSLVFGEPLGFLYVPFILFLIIFFMYVVLVAALIYIAALIQLILALMLGPIFMIFLMFNLTNHMFKAWIAFMAARAIEVILLFSLLYSFLLIIRDRFVELLSFRTCFESLFSGKLLEIMKTMNLNIEVWKSSFDYGFERSASEWFVMILILGVFIYLLLLLVKKSVGIANKLTIVGGSTAIGPSFAGAMAGLPLLGKFEKRISGMMYATPQFISSKVTRKLPIRAGKGGIKLADSMAGLGAKMIGKKDEYKTLKAKVKKPFKEIREEYRNQKRSIKAAYERGLYGKGDPSRLKSVERRLEGLEFSLDQAEHLASQKKGFREGMRTSLIGETRTDEKTRSDAIITVETKLDELTRKREAFDTNIKDYGHELDAKYIQLMREQPHPGKYDKYGKELISLSMEKSGQVVAKRDLEKARRELMERELEYKINSHAEMAEAYAGVRETILEEKEKYKELGKYKEETAMLSSSLEGALEALGKAGEIDIKQENIRDSIIEIRNACNNKKYDDARKELTEISGNINNAREKFMGPLTKEQSEAFDTMTGAVENFRSEISQAEANAAEYTKQMQRFDQLATQMEKNRIEEETSKFNAYVDLAKQQIKDAEDERNAYKKELTKVMGAEEHANIDAEINKKYNNATAKVLDPLLNSPTLTEETTLSNDETAAFVSPNVGSSEVTDSSKEKLGKAIEEDKRKQEALEKIENLKGLSEADKDKIAQKKKEVENQSRANAGIKVAYQSKLAANI